jgi:hypothetical protein
VLPSGGVKDKDRPFKTPDVIEAAVGWRDIAPSQVNEEGFARVVNPAMSEDIPDIVHGQIPLGETTVSVMGNGG